MLSNDKWRVSKDIHSLDNLIAWLETQPADKEYDYLDNQNCVLAQYFKASGIKVHGVAGLAYRTGENSSDYIPLPLSFQSVAVDDIRKIGGSTFGAALKRARKWKDKE